jgi:hypothetical protein
LAIPFFLVLAWGLWDLVFGGDFIPIHGLPCFNKRQSDQKPRDWISIASLDRRRPVGCLHAFLLGSKAAR